MCLYYSLLEDPYHEMERRHGKSIDSFIKRGNGMCKDQTISICYQGYEIWIVTKVPNLNEFSLYMYKVFIIGLKIYFVFDQSPIPDCDEVYAKLMDLLDYYEFFREDSRILY
jgi:hypothetical protein